MASHCLSNHAVPFDLVLSYSPKSPDVISASSNMSNFSPFWNFTQAVPSPRALFFLLLSHSTWPTSPHSEVSTPTPRERDSHDL